MISADNKLKRMVEVSRLYYEENCSQNEIAKKIAALGHDVEYDEKEATCLEDGYKKGTCKRCGMTANRLRE